MFGRTGRGGSPAHAFHSNPQHSSGRQRIRRTCCGERGCKARDGANSGLRGVMHLPMNSPPAALPRRFPVGAVYVVEGRSSAEGDLKVLSRYVVLPTGRRINVPAENAGRSRPQAMSGRHRRSRAVEKAAKSSPVRNSKKIAHRTGTAR